MPSVLFFEEMSIKVFCPLFIGIVFCRCCCERRFRLSDGWRLSLGLSCNAVFGCHHLSCCSVTKLCPTLCNPMDCSTPGPTVPHYLLEFAQVHVHWVSDAIQPSNPLLPSSPFALNLAQHQGPFKWVGSWIRWSKYQRFSVSFSNEYWGLISFRIHWLDLAVQGTLKNLLQHHSSKASILWWSAFFMVQLSHP